MRTISLLTGVLAPVALICLIPPSSLALNEATHQIINVRASRASLLDSVLKEQLGISEGTGQVIRKTSEKNTVEDWIRLGGALEDESTNSEYFTGKARSFRHFHDPLLAWDRSGLFFPFTIPPRFTRYESSIRWAQRTDQDQETDHGNYSWPAARQYFLTALTDADPARREQAFADTFRALGQIMHLVGDASVPEHVRNDSHAMGTIQDVFGQVGNYEYWVQVQHLKAGQEPAFIRDYLSTPITLDPELLRIAIPSTEAVARVPIARLFDSDRYTGTNPEVTAETRIGIAEVGNANFVSGGTGYGEYPHPALTTLPKYVATYSKTGEKRSYYRKERADLPVDPVAAECVLNEVTGITTLCLDDDVWRQTARLMLPRAVRFGQEVLDYFFRGKLDFHVFPSYQNTGQVDLTFYNNSAEPMTGSFILYTEDTDGKRVPVPGAAIDTLTLGGVPSVPGPLPGPGSPENPEMPPRDPEGPPGGYVPNSHTLTFTPDPGVKLRGLTLVFSGTLGAEAGAVVGKVKPWEPSIFVIQEFAELTGGEQVETHDWCLDPETGGVCWWNPSNSATKTRSKDPRLQRARGYFAAADRSDPGEFIQRIWVPTNQAIVLRLNGETVAGADWSRDKGPALVPTTWEILVDLTQSSDPSHVIGLPGLLIETRGGTQVWSDLLWWEANTSTGEAWHSYCYACCRRPLHILVQSETSISNRVEVSAWPEFTPVEGISGFEVGTYMYNWDWPRHYDENGQPIDPDCSSEGSIDEQYVAIFWDPVYKSLTNSATVSKGQSMRRRVEDSDRNAWANPPGPPPQPPQLVQELRFQRQYSPYEMQVYQLQGIAPPEYEIELR